MLIYKNTTFFLHANFHQKKAGAFQLVAFAHPVELHPHQVSDKKSWALNQLQFFSNYGILPFDSEANFYIYSKSQTN
jgi:hypothetical protein